MNLTREAFCKLWNTARRMKRIGSRSKYMPHQGERECARRRKQMGKTA